MKMWVTSDAHQEFLRDPEASRDPDARFHLGEHVPADADVCVIAGDLDVSLENSLRRIADELPGREVVYVPGNHDFWIGDEPPLTMDEMIDHGTALAAELGIHLLMDRSIELGGVRFVGATLWTDFMIGRGFLQSKLRDVVKGQTGMHDYKYMRRWSEKEPGQRRRMTPKITMVAHAASRAFIERTLAQPFPGETVVVTHHAPHPDSLDPRYSGSMDYCYASNLTLLLESDIAPALWVHGHIHSARDYVIGNTRVLANPRGYRFGPDKENDKRNGFDPSLVVELDGYDPKPGM